MRLENGDRNAARKLLGFGVFEAKGPTDDDGLAGGTPDMDSSS